MLPMHKKKFSGDVKIETLRFEDVFQNNNNSASPESNNNSNNNTAKTSPDVIRDSHSSHFPTASNNNTNNNSNNSNTTNLSNAAVSSTGMNATSTGSAAIMYASSFLNNVTKSSSSHHQHQHHERQDSGGIIFSSDNAQDYELDSIAAAVNITGSTNNNNNTTESGASSCCGKQQHNNNTSSSFSSNYISTSSSQQQQSRTTFVAQPNNVTRSLNSLSLFAILYSLSVGSGYGFEETVSLAGPLIVTLFCLIVPWIWCLPTALTVSELSAAMPSNAGFLAWSQTAFHPVITHFNVICTVLITFVGNAAYPALFAHYVSQYFGSKMYASSAALNSQQQHSSSSIYYHSSHHEQQSQSQHDSFKALLFPKSSPTTHQPQSVGLAALSTTTSPSSSSSYLFHNSNNNHINNHNSPTFVYQVEDIVSIFAKVLIMIVATVINSFGIQSVGTASIAVAAIATLPFLLLVLFQLTSGIWREDVAGTQTGLDFSTIFYSGPFKSLVNDVDWATFLAIATWNYANYDSAGSVTEEVINPQKAMPRAFAPLMLSTYFTYLFPVWAGVSVFSAGKEQHWGRWTTGYYTEIAYWIGGVPLQYLMRAGGVLVSIGYIITSLCCTSRTLAGIGQIGALPRPISRFLSFYHPRLATPLNAILLNGIVTLALSLMFSFQSLVALTQVLYMIRMLMMYSALLILRKSEPLLRRPFCIPLSFKGLCWFIAPAFIFCVIVLFACATQSNATLILCLIFIPGTLCFSFVYCNLVGFSPSNIAVVKEGSRDFLKLTDSEDDDKNEKNINNNNNNNENISTEQHNTCCSGIHVDIDDEIATSNNNNNNVIHQESDSDFEIYQNTSRNNNENDNDAVDNDDDVHTKSPTTTTSTATASTEGRNSNNRRSYQVVKILSNNHSRTTSNSENLKS